MAEITITSKYKKNLTASMHGDSLNIEVTGDLRQFSDTLFTYADAHKLADWIKDNIPEPPPAPPEWRVVVNGSQAFLEICVDGAPVHWPTLAFTRRSGEVVSLVSTTHTRHYRKVRDRITPELHKEMICALLDAHYAMHKGDS